VNDKSHSRTPL